ncbi:MULTISPECIES: pitrilysin family protein [unclassified Thioalkalivibrio]|uniref:M16 family metallopeptidase n=1 Tax=unclassified Thioalkalivibrio TaxID=2621013 RepID=UPI00036C9204|nr:MULTISPECIES: pitrilysin family protein [unclassified Thioalkalivibrio]
MRVHVPGLAPLLFCLMALFAAPAAASGSITDNVVETRLDNGLTVLVLEDRRAPVVSTQIWYRVGSADEYGGVTGISHMLEHMMFRGSEAFEPGEFSRVVSRLGGRENAFVGRDYTGYHQLLGSDHWETLLEMEAERMQHLRLTEEEFLPEREVVREERRQRVEDRPNARLREAFMAAAFHADPYGQPVIGWMSDIDEYSVEALQDWYDTWYTPDNAVVAVVGDVDADAVVAAAERHFGDIPAGAGGERPARSEPPQTGERRITVQVPAELPYVMMGWKAPSLNSLEEPDDAYALLVLEGVLSSGEASRLARELERGREIAGSASASYSPFTRRDGLFMLGGVPAADTDPGELEAALREQIERLREEPVGEDELERVQARVVASEVYGRDSVHAQASQLAMLETVGIGWQELGAFVERVRAVTAEDVRRVAQEYLVPETLTVGILDPLPLDERESEEPAAEYGGAL